MLTIKSALISLQGLLASPEPKDPQDAEVASMLLKNPEEFKYVAQSWAVQYAGAPPKEDPAGSGDSTQKQFEEKARQRQQEKDQLSNTYARPVYV